MLLSIQTVIDNVTVYDTDATKVLTRNEEHTDFAIERRGLKDDERVQASFNKRVNAFKIVILGAMNIKRDKYHKGYLIKQML